MIGIAVLSAYNRPMYLASVVLKEISVCSCDFHIKGHPDYDMTYLCLEKPAST